MKRVFLITLCIFITAYGRAQENRFTQSPDPLVFKSVTREGWIKFQDNFKADPEKIFELNGRAFGLTGNFKMKLQKRKDDRHGAVHLMFKQTLSGIEILGGEYIIHSKNEQLISGNGKIYTASNIKNKITLSEQRALGRALAEVKAEKYFWQDPVKEAKAKKKQQDPFATYYPKATMIYVFNAEKNELVLCYRFYIYAHDFGKSCISYIDVADGIVVKKTPLDMNCIAASVQTTYYGVQTIFTIDESGDGTNYELEDDCTTSVFQVFNASTGDIINSPDNNWSTQVRSAAATSLWSVKTAYRWFGAVFHRKGHDDNDGDIDIQQGYNFGTDANPNYNNASYSYDLVGDDDIKVGLSGSATNKDDYNTIDILAHEFTHGVTRYEADLTYEKEPGALNESFSDIMGEWIEHKQLGQNDWFIGAERSLGCGALRCIFNSAGQNVNVPPGTCTISFNNPNTYMGRFWQPAGSNCTPTGPNTPGDNDYCGVHTNSGVQNQMFFLLSQGGNGWNDGNDCFAPVNTGYSWSVSGIGINKAAEIAYDVLCNYLTSTSTYIDARNAWVAAAENIYGVCSFEAIQAGRAWYAVGIAPPVPQAAMFCNLEFGAVPYAFITPKDIITTQGCFVNITPTGNNILFQAGNTITFNPGFYAAQGSSFHAIVSDCHFAAY
ncbi:MAG: M4 family metallopeptidase [Agriterribacter sp.]